MAQRSDLLDLAQLPAAQHQSPRLSHRHSRSAAVDEDHPDPRTAASPLETSIGEHFLKRGFGCWLVAGVAMKKAYTDKQGQYLAFIYYYNKIHGCAPSEAELQNYFRVSPPSVHQMILTLEARGLIERTPGQARSIHLLIPREEIPDLA
jgi:repressor LexA